MSSYGIVYQKNRDVNRRRGEEKPLPSPAGRKDRKSPVPMTVKKAMSTVHGMLTETQQM
jgi:hypothetical protein